MDEVSVARRERTEERDRDERDRRDRREGDRLYDVLAALPLKDRIAAIERMADRMGV